MNETLWQSETRIFETVTNTTKKPNDLFEEFLSKHIGEPAKIFVEGREVIEAILVSGNNKKVLLMQRQPKPQLMILPTQKIVAIATE